MYLPQPQYTLNILSSMKRVLWMKCEQLHELYIKQGFKVRGDRKIYVDT